MKITEIGDKIKIEFKEKKKTLSASQIRRIGKIGIGNSVSLANDNVISECEKKLSDLVRVIVAEFNRGPVTIEIPIFFGLFTRSYEAYNVLPENRKKVQNFVPIENCSENDLHNSVKSVALEPETIVNKNDIIAVIYDDDSKYKSAQFILDKEKKL